MKEVTSVNVTLTRADDSVIALEYMALGDLFDVHTSAEAHVEKLQGLKEGDRVLVTTVETKTGNSVNTAVTRGAPCPF